MNTESAIKEVLALGISTFEYVNSRLNYGNESELTPTIEQFFKQELSDLWDNNAEFAAPDDVDFAGWEYYGMPTTHGTYGFISHDFDVWLFENSDGERLAFFEISNRLPVFAMHFDDQFEFDEFMAQRMNVAYVEVDGEFWSVEVQADYDVASLYNHKTDEDFDWWDIDLNSEEALVESIKQNKIGA